MSLRSLTLVAGLLAGLAIPTLAHAAYTTASVNIRSGPGTQYYVVGTAPPGAWIGVHSCLSRWCSVTYAGVTGWMSSAYISYARRAPYYAPKPYVYRPLPPPPVYYYPPPYAPRYYPPPYPRRYPPPPPVYRPHGYYGFYFGLGR
jgi:uncharacterized protein YraI